MKMTMAIQFSGTPRTTNAERANKLNAVVAKHITPLGDDPCGALCLDGPVQGQLIPTGTGQYILYFDRANDDEAFFALLDTKGNINQSVSGKYPHKAIPVAETVTKVNRLLQSFQYASTKQPDWLRFIEGGGGHETYTKSFVKMFKPQQ
jgi:hypothetical protein